MPKSCSVTNCKNDSGTGGDRRSFYKFPLQDPLRLQQWLRNMGRENWTPSRHQYICHEHFAPSCFRVRWGIRYLENDAVPTLFQQSEKRKCTDDSERKLKRPKADGGVITQSSLQQVDLYEVAVEPLRMEPDSLASVEAGVSFPTTLSQTRACRPGEEGDSSATEVELFAGLAFLSPDGTLVLDESTGLDEGGAHELVAYFETIPNILAGEASAQLRPSPDTVLSAALSSEPITATLPIVSKHCAPPSLAVERLHGEEEEDGGSDEDEPEQDDHQREEHSYHKNSLSREQLEAAVVELQRKVKVLQQRHRRHLDKLAGLENTVSRLRQSNLLNEERLQLLERALPQSGAAVPGGSQTVAIIYEEDSGAYFYAPQSEAAALSVDLS